MGATSVTGVSGPGSVRGKQKGSPHDSLGVSRLIGPRVVSAGSATLDGAGTVTIDFPDIGGVAGDYIAIAVSNDPVANAVNVTALTTTSITLLGNANDPVSYAIIKVGLGVPVIQTA